MKRQYLDILITYGPLLMMGPVAANFSAIWPGYFILAGVVWIFVWRLGLRKKYSYFNSSPAD